MNTCNARPKGFSGQSGAGRRLHFIAQRLAMKTCTRRINPSIFPPYPPTRKLRPRLGRTLRHGGAAIGFCYAGRGAESLKPVDSGSCHHANPGLTKASARFATLLFPRFCDSIPRVYMFVPRVMFLACAGLVLSFSSSSLEREKREERMRGEVASTGCVGCEKWHPRVGGAIHGFSVDGVWLQTRASIGFLCFQGHIHASTGGNAGGGAAMPWRGLAHG